MSEYFYQVENAKKLAQFKQIRPDLFQAFADFNAKVFAEGALSAKVKELIAVAAAHMTQCPYCIAGHTKKAKAQGASDAEITEAIFVAMALRAGGSFAHGTVALEAMEAK